MNIKIVFNKFILVKEKIMEQVYRIGIDHGYGNILCKGKYNPDTF